MKRSRLHTREQRLRHEAKLMHLAALFGIQEPWKTHLAKRGMSGKCTCWWCTVRKKKERPLQERKLDLRDQEGELE